MARQNDLFPETKAPSAPKIFLAHVIDAGTDCALFRCNRCGWESDWLVIKTVTEGKRGVPCEPCNAPRRVVD